MTAVAEQTGAWLAEFTPAARGRAMDPAASRGRLPALRGTGFPTTHDEEWRFTNVAPIARTRFRAAAPTRLLTLPDALGKPNGDALELSLAGTPASNRTPSWP